MSVTINIHDISFSSCPVKVEAYRRARELREFVLEKNSNGSFDRWEHFRWVTSQEIEEVTIDHQEGLITYSVILR